jgi:hypothetical protein
LTELSSFFLTGVSIFLLFFKCQMMGLEMIVLVVLYTWLKAR